MAAGLMVKDALRTRLPGIQYQFQILKPNPNIRDCGRVQKSDFLDKSIVASKRVAGTAPKLLPCRLKPSCSQERGVADAKPTQDRCKSETCVEAEGKELNLADIACDDNKSEKKVLDLSMQDCKNKLREKCDLAGKKWSEGGLTGKLTDAGNELRKKVPDSWKTLTCRLKGLQENVAKALGKKGD